MEMMRESFRRFLADQGGATAVEYCVICGCIFLVIIAAMVNFGSAAGNMFNNLSNVAKASGGRTSRMSTIAWSPITLAAPLLAA